MTGKGEVMDQNDTLASDFLNAEEVPFCGCTNEELEGGKTCGQPQCPNNETPLWRAQKDVPISLSRIMADDEEAALDLTDDVWITVWNAIDDALEALNRSGELPNGMRVGAGFAYDDIDVTEDWL